MSRAEQIRWLHARRAQEVKEARPLPWKTDHNLEHKKRIEEQYDILVRRAKAQGDVEMQNHLKAVPLALNPEHNLSPEKMNPTLKMLLMGRACVELCYAFASMGSSTADALHDALVKTDGKIEKLEEMRPAVRSAYSALLSMDGDRITLVEKYWY
jgi:hypothetical protein